MEALQIVEKSSRKAKLPQIQPGDTVRVHQMIREGNKSRVQVFEGVVIRQRKSAGIAAHLTVRKIASGVGVEKSWFLHSPNVVKVEVVRRSKVRRAYLSYLRGLRGKKARLSEQEFDKALANEADTRTQAEIEADEQAKVEDSKSADKVSKNDETTDAIESVEVVESTEDLAKAEDKAAATADPEFDEAQPGQDDQDLSNTQGDDETLLPAEEKQAGIDKAEDDITSQQNKK